MRFKDVPIFYTPYIAFPLGDDRQSGLLFPSFGHSGNNGYQLDVPYYFNLAPNYDATLTPGLLSARGVQLGGEFRFLTAGSHGQIEENFLPNDAIAAQRPRLRALHRHHRFRTGPALRYRHRERQRQQLLQRFRGGLGSDQRHLPRTPRRAPVLRRCLADPGAAAEFPDHRHLASMRATGPIRACRGSRPMACFRSSGSFEFALSSEVTNFLREVGPDGRARGLVAGAALVGAEPGYFFEPVVGYHFTQYDLQNAAVGDPSTPTRTLPYASVDTGLIFERDAGSQGQRTQTLEPRLMYSYVPYRNQNELPIFDTGLPDLNLVELFRTNRYVGDDRIGDANQLAMGLTTRLFSQSTGAQYLSATIGQIRYFTLPRVFLPDEITQTLPGPDASYLARAAEPGHPAGTESAHPARADPRHRPGDTARGLSRLGHRRRDLGDGVQELELQPRLPVESLHLADRQIRGSAPVPPRSQQGGEHRLPLPGGHPEAIRRLLCLAHRQPLEHRRALCLLPPGPPNHRATGRIRVQKLLLAHPGVAAALLDQPDRGTRHLDCITIGTDGPKFGRKAGGCLLERRSADTRRATPTQPTPHSGPCGEPWRFMRKFAVLCGLADWRRA